jgi:hypothetical protein
MLTKEERAAIAERLKSTEYITSSTLFKALTGEEKLSETSHVKSLCIICSVILGLCDTSNMIELPRDKDGEVIRIGDTVYDYENIEYKVEGYAVYKSCTCAFLTNTAELIYAKRDVNNLTHKQPVTIKSLAQRIKHVLEDEATSIGVNPYVELGRIAEQLESLGDSDD